MVSQLYRFRNRTITDLQSRCMPLHQSAVRRIKRTAWTFRASAFRWLAGLVVATSVTTAQDPIPIDQRETASIHGERIVRRRPVSNTGTELPTWPYQTVSPVNGASYTGYMVGTSPFLRTARTTTIPVVLVPLIVQFTNTNTGFTTTFDPSTAPDAGCTAGQTAMSLVENSPIFQSRSWILNGVDVGVTQYIDAFQRSNFWQYVRNPGNDWHTLLTYTVGEPLMLPPRWDG